MPHECLFRAIYACSKRKDFATSITNDRLEKIYQFSKENQDGIHERLNAL